MLVRSHKATVVSEFCEECNRQQATPVCSISKGTSQRAQSLQLRLGVQVQMLDVNVIHSLVLSRKT